MSKILLIGGEKGGTGKSTIATNLAIMSAMLDYDTIILDCDKQQTTQDFISLRSDLNLKPTPPCVQIRGKHLKSEIENLSVKYEVVIIDAGGQDSVEMRSAMVSPSVTNMYIPVQASSFDLKTLLLIDELVELSQSFNENLRAFALINRASTHPRITNANDAKEFISELSNISLCKSTLSERIAYQYASGKGQAVVEFESEKIKKMPSYQSKSHPSKASDEIIALFEEVFKEDFVTADIEKSKVKQEIEL